MRVAHICTKFNRISETFIYDLVVGLEQAGVENHVLTGARVNAAERPFPRVRVLDIPLWRQVAFAVQKHWFNVYHFPLPPRTTREALRGIRPDIILAHFGGAGAAIAPMARELGIPLVVVFHAFDLFMRQFRPATYAALWASGAQAVVVSEHGKRRLLELGCPAERVRVIHCGVDSSRFALDAVDRSAKDGIRIVTIARFVEKKGLEDLLCAVDAARRRLGQPVRLDLWGDGPLLRRLAALISELGLQTVAALRGVVASQDVPRLLRQYDAFALPSKTARNGDTEGIPITILEAQAAGLPVVATRHAGIPEALPPENRDLLATEGDVRELGAKLTRLARRRDEWAQIGLRGREWVERHFSLAGEVESYRLLLNDVAFRPGGAGMTLGATGLGLTALRAFNAALGLLLSMALAAVFGVNRDVDALFVAMAVGVFLARDLSRVVRTAAVPCLVEHDAGAGHAGFPAMFQAAAVLLAVALASLVWLGAPWVVRITSPGFDPDAAQTAQRLLRLLAPSLLLFMLFGSAQAVFHARRRFFVPEIGETVWRLMALAALYGPGRWWGLEAYAQGLVIAALVQWLLVFAIGAFSGLPVVPTRWIPIRLGILRPLWLGAAVVLVSVAQLQVEGVLDRTALSFMAPGSLAIFSYAERLAHMAPLLLSTSLLTPWLPEMARIRARIRDPRRLAKQGSLFLAGLGALLALVIAWGAPDAVDLLLRRGKFDAASAAVAVRALRAFALGIPAIYCVQCLAGLYIVERDVKAMFRMGVVAVLAHGLGNVVLLGWGVTGIAFSGSVSIWLVATYLWLRVRTVERVWFDWPRFAFAMAAAVAALYAIPWAALLPWAPVRLVAGAFAAWAAYMAVLWPAIRRMQAYEREATHPTD